MLFLYCQHLCQVFFLRDWEADADIVLQLLAFFLHDYRKIADGLALKQFALLDLEDQLETAETELERMEMQNKHEGIHFLDY